MGVVERVIIVAEGVFLIVEEDEIHARRRGDQGLGRGGDGRTAVIGINRHGVVVGAVITVAGFVLSGRPPAF
jgi:hypothetical protein